jgi:protein-disulfide isomerase
MQRTLVRSFRARSAAMYGVGTAAQVLPCDRSMDRRDLPIRSRLTPLRSRGGRFAVVLAISTTLAVVLAAASVLGAHEGPAARDTESAPAVTAHEPTLFDGIEQHAAALGSPDAPLTLVEYADLQCPYCAQWAHETLPTLIEDYVRQGKLRIVFNGLAFIGDDSDTALRTAIASGRQNHLWDVVHGFYVHQGGENAGWVTDELIRAIAGGVAGLDGDRILDERWESGIESELKHAADEAHVAGVAGTPAFQLGPTGGALELLRIGSIGPEGIVPAIEAALA